MDIRQRRRIEKRSDMSRHEGVSCDACMKSNFKGRRMKCLRCYDYDLCAHCFEAGAATSRHSADHPVQCILTRSDFDLYYSGETNPDLSYSFTCPVCGKLGLTEIELQAHVVSEHANSSIEIVCPICAHGGEPNLVTDDFIAHLTIEHRQQQRDSVAEEASTSRQNLRRVQQPSRTLGMGRGRRPVGAGAGGISPSGPTVDPIAELLSQLSGVRRQVPYDRLLHPRHGQQQLQSLSSQGNPTPVTASASVRSRGVFPPTANQGTLHEGTIQQALPDLASIARHEKRQFLLDRQRLN